MKTVIIPPENPATVVAIQDVSTRKFYGVQFPGAGGNRYFIVKLHDDTFTTVDPYLTVSHRLPKTGMALIDLFRKLIFDGWQVVEFDSFKELAGWLS